MKLSEALAVVHALPELDPIGRRISYTKARSNLLAAAKKKIASTLRYLECDEEDRIYREEMMAPYPGQYAIKRET